MSGEPTQPVPTPDRVESPELFDYSQLRNYAGFVLRSPGRHVFLAAASFLLVMGLAGAAAMLLPDVYESEATILALRNPTLLRGADWDAPTRAARETVLRHANLLLLCDQTNLVDRYLQGRSPLARLRAWMAKRLTGRERTRNDLREMLVDTLEDRLAVTVSPEGVIISAKWTDPQVAYELVDAAVQNFLEARYSSESADLGETITLLEGRAAKHQQQMEVAAASLEKKERERRRSAAPRHSVPALAVRREGAPGRLASMLSAKRQALADVEEFRARRLEELRTQLAQKQLIYADRHPEVLITRNSIELLSQPSPQVEAMRAEVRELERANAGGAGSPAVAAAGAMLGSPSGEPDLRLESEDVRSALDRSQLQLVFEQYASTVLRLESARMELDLARAAFKTRYSVTSPPKLPRGPYKNNTLRRALAGLIGGIGLAFFASVAADLRAKRVLERWQIERLIGLPVLAELER